MCNRFFEEISQKAYLCGVKHRKLCLRDKLEPLFNKHQMRMNIYLTKEFERLAYVTRKHHEIMVLEKT